MNLVWFRSDLRTANNPALFHALDSGDETVALFVICSEQHVIHGEAPQKLEFIKAHIQDLIFRLRKLGVESIVKQIPKYSDVPPVFKQLIDQYKIKKVFHDVSYWINEIDRDQSVKKLLKTEKIDVHEFHSNYLLPPGTVRKKDGSMYHVFTPYKKQFIERLKCHYRLPLGLPVKDVVIENTTSVLDSEQLNVNFKHRMWPIGEIDVAKKVKTFLKTVHYKNDRDYPALDGTSSLSPYLSIGVFSAQQCLAHAIAQKGESAFYSTWISELIWRDYYNDLMYEYPHLAKHKAFKPLAKDLWVDDPELLSKWKSGQTGFPIIDAGMRQLLTEGWMHNRVRMLVASFLCKLCLIDWRKGESHFMAHLLDGDLASNNGGWQWSSATGCDSAPYFRIFNPVTQSKKFDQHGDYIKKYVAELQGVHVDEIHDPKTNTRLACDYPQPVVNYKQARVKALDWFKR